MKIVIIGGVAAGTKAAAKLKRENPDAEITIYTKSKDTSYAGCSLPYYIGGSIESRDQLIIASGAEPIIPPVEGISLSGVFSVRTPEDAINARNYAEVNNCRHGNPRNRNSSGNKLFQRYRS